MKKISEEEINQRKALAQAEAYSKWLSTLNEYELDYAFNGDLDDVFEEWYKKHGKFIGDATLMVSSTGKSGGE